MLVASAGCYLYYFRLTSYKSEVPMTSSLGSINVIEQLRELRKLDYLYIIEKYNLEIARWARYEERAWSFHAFL